jgi:predicted RNA-binding Zn ribbon-like protein
MILLVTVESHIERGAEGPAVAWVRRPAARQPGNRAPAPGDLELVQAFVNTFWDIDRGGAERLVDGSALAAWFAGYGLLGSGTTLGEADLRRALDVRAGLRALLSANNGAAVDGAAIERLNRALRGPGLVVQLGPSTPPGFSAPRRDLDGALASIATIVALAQIDGTWYRLKACRGEHCGWAFYDHSRNQSGTWCAMSLCGARAKARDYRRRKRRSGEPEHDRAT